MPNEYPIMNIRSKYADQTPEGKDLDNALETLQGAIEENAPYDGIVEYVFQSTDYIKKETLPSRQGIYKIMTNNGKYTGYMMYYPVTDTTFKAIGMINKYDPFIFVTLSAVSKENNFNPGYHRLETGTKLYRHTLSSALNGSSKQIIITNNSATSITTKNQLYYSHVIENSLDAILYETGSITTINKIISTYGTYAAFHLAYIEEGAIVKDDTITINDSFTDNVIAL